MLISSVRLVNVFVPGLEIFSQELLHFLKSKFALRKKCLEKREIFFKEKGSECLKLKDIKVGDEIISSLKNAPIKIGNAMPLNKIPAGQIVHNIELIPGKGSQMVRSAGLGAQVLAKDLNMVTIKLPSGETRMFSENCLATIGEIGNKSHETCLLYTSPSPRDS